jgi:NADH-quinone oxidoreductase subunit M
LNKRELALLVPLIAAIIWLGVYPAPVLRRMEGSAQLLVDRVHAREAQTREPRTDGGGVEQVSEASR